MTESEIEREVLKFRSAAIAKGALAAPESRDTLLHDEMRAAWAALEAMGHKGREAFRALLDDSSEHVRTWVAAQLIVTGDREARRVLSELALLPGRTGFDAAMVLRESDAGRLSGPFTTQLLPRSD